MARRIGPEICERGDDGDLLLLLDQCGDLHTAAAVESLDADYSHHFPFPLLRRAHATWEPSVADHLVAGSGASS